MADKTINTVIVLRNDQTTNWESSTYKLMSGEVGVGYLDRTLDDGTTKKVPIIKVGDGEHTWIELPQAEGVFVEDQILTYNFGRHKTSNGYVNAGGAGMTTSEWLLDALSEILNPTVNYPSASLAAGTITTDTGDFEIGSKIKSFKWNGSTSFGSYKDAANSGTYGTTVAKTSYATGISASDFTWSVTNSKTSTTGTTEDGTVTLASEVDYIQIDSTSSKEYATFDGTVTFDPSNARIPLNNVGATYEAGKIKGFDAAGTTTKTFSGIKVLATGFRKPFWGYKLTADALTDPTKITSDQVRALGNGGTSASSLPTSLTVPADTKQVYIAAVSGTKSDLTVKNVTKEPATGVACTKVASGVNVKGANDFDEAAYDLWYVNLDAAFTGSTNLSLTWS